jgi:hypothetical protein
MAASVAAAAAAAPTPLTIFVLGASGDLAKKKTYPSLFELYVGGFLPPGLQIVGYARSELGLDAFRAIISNHLVGGDAAQRSGFLDLCTYCSGGYGDAAAFGKAVQLAALKEGEGQANRLFYFALPPAAFLEAAGTVAAAGMVRTPSNVLAHAFHCSPSHTSYPYLLCVCGHGCFALSFFVQNTRGWSRVVVEKVGHSRCHRDLGNLSFDSLSCMASVAAFWP